MPGGHSPIAAGLTECLLKLTDLDSKAHEPRPGLQSSSFYMRGSDGWDSHRNDRLMTGQS